MFNSPRSSVQRLEMSDKVTVACKNMCTAASASCMPVPGSGRPRGSIRSTYSYRQRRSACLIFSQQGSFCSSRKTHESGSKLRYGILGPAFLRGLSAVQGRALRGRISHASNYKGLVQFFFCLGVTSIGPRTCRQGIDGGTSITHNPASNLISTEEEISSILDHVRVQALGLMSI